jgi:hypothetical protein
MIRYFTIIAILLTFQSPVSAGKGNEFQKELARSSITSHKFFNNTCQDSEFKARAKCYPAGTGILTCETAVERIGYSDQLIEGKETCEITTERLIKKFCTEENEAKGLCGELQ